MPQTVTITSEAYSFDELDDEAKERARDWYRECIDEDDFSCEIDEFVSICNILGIDLKTREVALMSGKTRSDPNIWYSIGGCQGDGACFEGTYSHNGDSCAKIRELNDDEKWEPVRIADELNRIQSARILLGRERLTATIEKTSHRYCHENTVDIDVDDDADTTNGEERSDEEEFALGKDGDAIAELMRDLMRYLYWQLCDQRDYLYSDEAVDESILANEYMFEKDGRRHRYA
jgi:hypothetical protein